MSPRRRITQRTLESAALYALAFECTKTMHEIAHAAVGYWLHQAPVLFHDHVTSVDGSVIDEVLVAAAGPLFSGLSGFVFFLLAKRSWSRWPLLRLFVVWLGYHGAINLVGYLFTTCFAAGGDIGKIAGLLELPDAISIVITVLAGASFRYVPRPFAGPLAALSDKPLETPEAAKSYAREIGLYAGLLATPILILTLLPVPHWIALLYATVSAFPLFNLPKALVEARQTAVSQPLRAARPIPAMVVFACVVVAVRLSLAGGVAFDPRAAAHAGSGS